MLLGRTVTKARYSFAPHNEHHKLGIRIGLVEGDAAEGKEDERFRYIRILEQKASSLEAEIARRKRAEAAVREEQTKLAMAVAVAQLGIWELDLRTRFFTTTDQCHAQFGLAPSEPFTYARFLQLIHPEDREAVRMALRAAGAARGNYTVEFRVIDPAGRLRWIACMGRFLQNGAPRMVGATLDITERKCAAEMLEQAVNERTSRLQECLADLETFSCSISHDMRAPLHSMHGFASILTQEYAGKLDPQGRAYLALITSSADRMDRLIQDVLSFSRVARSDLQLEAVDLNRLARGVIESSSSSQASQAQIAIEGTLPCVLGNAASLTQCLSNLLDNAIKFVAPGTPPRIRLWAEPFQAVAGHSLVRLYIQDNGIGIPKEAHDKIFTIFHRLNEEGEGTGIGLAIVKRAAERMGGRVGVNSEPGRGSTFWLELKEANPVAV
jgi:PAS domain S-box-containing protein